MSTTTTGRHRCQRRCSGAHDAALPPAHAQCGAQAGGEQPIAARATSFIDAFWKFLRPHTIRGTILGASAVTARALLENQLVRCQLLVLRRHRIAAQQLIDWGLLPRALLGVLALLCGNGYIVGINQIFDVDIDVVNKPFLPVAAGAYKDATHAPRSSHPSRALSCCANNNQHRATRSTMHARLDHTQAS